MFVKTEDGKQKDVDLLQVTKENYIVPDSEKTFFHVVMEIKKFDANTGARISRPRLQKFDSITFKRLRDNFERQGYTLEILYDPTDYIKEFGGKLQTANAAAQKQRIDAAVKAALAAHEADIQSRIDAAVKAALAEKKAKKTE